jgi:hypothetical protein
LASSSNATPCARNSCCSRPCLKAAMVSVVPPIHSPATNSCGIVLVPVRGEDRTDVAAVAYWPTLESSRRSVTELRRLRTACAATSHNSHHSNANNTTNCSGSAGHYTRPMHPKSYGSGTPQPCRSGRAGF